MKRVGFFAAALVSALAGCAGPTFEVGTPFAVAFTEPSHGAVDIAVDTDVRVGFNLPVDRDAARANISLTSGDAPMELSVLFAEGERVVVLVPVRTLPTGATVTLLVGPDVQSSGGTDLDSSLLADFTTAQ